MLFFHALFLSSRRDAATDRPGGLFGDGFLDVVPQLPSTDKRELLPGTSYPVLTSMGINVTNIKRSAEFTGIDIVFSRLQSAVVFDNNLGIIDDENEGGIDKLFFPEQRVDWRAVLRRASSHLYAASS